MGDIPGHHPGGVLMTYSLGIDLGDEETQPSLFDETEEATA